MKSNPKQIIETSKNYLEYIKEQSCLITCQKAEPHHTISRGSFGSDYMTIPLSCKLHTECHAIGRATFQEKYGISFDKEIIRLLIGYIKHGITIK